MMNLKQRAAKLKYDLPAIYLALKDSRTPLRAKLPAMILVAYALSPVDLIPDFIPVLGYLDDLIILPVLIHVTVKLIPEDIMLQCRKEAEDIWKDGKPQRWYYAVGIILIWVMIIVLIMKKYMRNEAS